LTTSWGSTGPAGGQFNGPTGIATDNSYIYVADTGNNRIQQFTMSGSYVSTICSGYYLQSQQFAPRYIALDGNGNLFTANNYSGTIAEFSISDGSYIKSINAYYSSGYATVQIQGLAFDKNGNLLVSTTDSVVTLQSLKTDGTLLKQWALTTCSGSMPASNIATDNVNNIIYYVTICGGVSTITGYTQQ
jgi:sugar lactone lactonase YvrE